MREQLLDAAQTLVQKRGLNAVSFQDLADAVGLKKPSVFHHFPSKDALARSLLERCRTSYGARYGAVLAREDIGEPEKLREIARLFDQGLKEDHLCLLAAMASNGGEFSPELELDLEQTSSVAIERYTTVFATGRETGTLTYSGTPEEAATAFLAMLQGLQILMRSNGKTDAYLPVAMAYIDSIAT